MGVADARKYVEAAFEKLTPAKAQELAKSLAQGGGKDQVTKLAHELMEWSTKNRARLTEMIDREIGDQLKRNRERITEFIDREVRIQFKKNRDKVTELVRREVQRQVKALGLATKSDLDGVKKRVRELERASGPAKRTAARKPAARKPAAKRAAAPPTPPAAS